MLPMSLDMTGGQEKAAAPGPDDRERERAATAPFRAAIDFFRLDPERRAAPAAPAITIRGLPCVKTCL